jgi:hypothetical protein
MKLYEIEIKAIKILLSVEMYEYGYIKGFQRGDYNGNLYNYLQKVFRTLSYLEQG